MAKAPEFAQIFEYLQAPLAPDCQTGLLIFGRNDERLVDPARLLVQEGIARWIIVSGGLGKDSGSLWQTDTSEAGFIGQKLVEAGLGTLGENIFLEEVAMAGNENARFGLRVMRRINLDHDTVTAVAHATSLRRLSATLQHEAGGSISRIFRMPTRYPYDPSFPRDQREAVEVLLRLADWPARGWLPQQQDLPQNLVDFAKDTGIPTPKRPSPLITAVLRAAPIGIRQRIIESTKR